MRHIHVILSHSLTLALTAVRTSAGIKKGEYSEVLETESLEVLALNSSSVTKVISLSALHHHPMSTRWKVIAESFRVLRPGGVLAFAEILDGYLDISLYLFLSISPSLSVSHSHCASCWVYLPTHSTPPAKFIADVVHRLSLTGHVAEFVKTGELANMLSTTGFEHVRETYLTVRAARSAVASTPLP